jgi:hypothetical protein
VFRKERLLLVTSVAWLATLLAFSGYALAAPQTYRGTLQGKTLEQPAAIPVTLIMDFVGIRVSGRATTSSPLSGGGVLEGERNGYQCGAKAELGNGTILNLRGHCDDMSFDGQYRIRFRSGQSWQGTFKALRVGPEPRPGTKGQGAMGGGSKPDADLAPRGIPARSKTDCLRQKSACLVGCPTGDPSVELLCADRCKKRYEACAPKAP